MKNDNAKMIPNPYHLMLNLLKDITGYKEFCNFIDSGSSSNEDWKAEIKALFEINKGMHPLISICSQNESEPEGIFEINDKNGILNTYDPGSELFLLRNLFFKR